jgi:hypothetical protein
MKLSVSDTMRWVALLAWVGWGVALFACTPQQSQTSVASLEVALTGADQLAIQYIALPPCGLRGSPTLCSDTNKVAAIKQSGLVAYNDVKAAEANNTSAMMAVASAAIATYAQLIPVAETNN